MLQQLCDITVYAELHNLSEASSQLLGCVKAIMDSCAILCVSFPFMYAPTHLILHHTLFQKTQYYLGFGFMQTLKCKLQFVHSLCFETAFNK